MAESYPVHTFPRVFVTCDVVAIRALQGRRELLLIERKKDPFKGAWALPGGFFDIDADEVIEDAAARELYEETNLRVPSGELRLLGVFSRRGRDPREAIASEPCRILSVAYTVAVTDAKSLKAKDDASRLQWFDLDQLPALAFDHGEIIGLAIKNELIER